MRMANWLIVAGLCMSTLAACHGAATTTKNPMTQTDALALAVQLANEECMRQFSVAPFEGSNYPIELREGWWHWGELNVHGVGGYSATVSFDGTGGDRRVEVFFSTDKLSPRD